jgi:hypothetical protein
MQAQQKGLVLGQKRFDFVRVLSAKFTMSVSTSTNTSTNTNTNTIGSTTAWWTCVQQGSKILKKCDKSK